MSRSIHTTHRDLEDQKRFINADKDKIQKLYEKISKKRRLKNQEKSRRLNEKYNVPAVSPEGIPIFIVDEGENIHYPASPDDLRAILHCLPGVYDGISEIRLSLGKNEQEKSGQADGNEWLSPDPYTGRLGDEIIPGAYIGHCGGTYNPNSTLIHLFAYVYDRSIPDIKMWELYFRLKMLSTFVHELGHHYDYFQRWQMLDDSMDKDERVADRFEYRWVQDYVLPYLKKKYPSEVKQLCDWIEEHGGLSVSLDMLAPDPRVTEENGWVKILFGGVPCAVESLAKNAAEGAEPDVMRMNFAWNLHVNEHYNESLNLLESILEQQPDKVEALILKADTLVHVKKHDAAKRIVEDVLTKDNRNVEAWEVLANIYNFTEEWGSLLKASLNVLSFVVPEQPEWGAFMKNCVIAKIELGDNDGIEIMLSDIEANDGRRGERIANDIRRHYLTSIED